jgi:hypothetical protein
VRAEAGDEEIMSVMTDAWIACKGRSGEEVRAILRLRETARKTWAPDGSEVWGADLPSGWYLVWCCDLANPCVSREAPLAELSRGGIVVGALAVSFGPQQWSASFLYQDGVELWRVSQDVQDGRRSELKVEGTMPPQQFSDPLDLAQQICGYHHDQRFTELVR